MKKLLLSLLLVCTVAIASSQNYWQAYPLVAQVTSNGGQQRIEVSVYDSLLQSSVYYNTPYYPCSLAIKSNNNGMMTFNSWINSSTQDSIFGYIVYDYELVQFAPVISSFNVANDFYINSDILWVRYFEEVDYGNGESYTYAHYARYDIKAHEWKVINYGYFEEFLCGTGGGTNMTGVRWNVSNCDDEGIYWLYDPAIHAFSSGWSGCMAWNFNAQDDYLEVDVGCGENAYYVYDLSTHSWQKFEKHNTGQQNGGIFYANGPDYEWKYFGTYDEMLSQWMIDSTDNNYSSPLNVQIKDRVVGYIDPTSNPDRMHFLAYSPTLHSWVKDSADAPGVTSFTIQNGTISWTDSSGPHIRGYNDATGWGNFYTPLLLNFYLTDLAPSTGYPMIHVRNYSIGTDSIKYNFGDGVTSISNTKVLWHLYKTGGPFNVCITNNSGTQSWCQNVSYSFCSVAGTASITQDSLCYGDSTLLSLAGYTGSIQWQKAAGVGTWINDTTAGSTSNLFKVIPSQTTTYRAMVIDSTCIPAFSNTLTVAVTPLATVGTATISYDTICSGKSAVLKLTGYAGQIQWQRFNVSNWVNETGTCNTCYQYTVSPAVNRQYRAVVTTPFCGSDTSITLSLTVLPSLADPVTVNDTTCGPGVVNLSASGAGVFNWFTAATGGSLVNTGTTFSPSISTTKTYYVQASTGATSNVGPIDTTFGIVGNVSGSYYGLQFDVTQPSTIEKVYVYPKQSGSTYIRLYNASGQLLNYKSINVTAGTGKTPVQLEFTVNPDSGYRLLLQSGNYLKSNLSNASYPYTVANSPLTITGYYNNSFHTDSLYYFFYDWVVREGCESNLVPVKGVVLSPPTVGAATISYNTICSGTSAVLKLTGYAGQIQWQSFNGSNWINETGSCNKCSQYTVSPAASKQYRAVVTTPFCGSATSITLSLTVIPSLADPVTVNDTTCGPGVVNLSASGAGVFNWFTAATGGSLVNTGTTFSPSISTTKTYYVQASTGATSNVGPIDTTFGIVGNVSGSYYGLQFDVTQPSTIEKVYVYPKQSGSTYIRLYNASGQLLNSKSINVTAGAGKTPVHLGFVVNPDSGYRLLLQSGNYLKSNISNASYPYTVANSPLTITGYYNNSFHTDSLYYFFYDWVVREGCESNLVPVKGVVLSLPSAVITPNGPLSFCQGGSVLLTANSGTGFTYQWKKNGTNISGATLVNYTATTAGSYTVAVSNSCGSSTSSPVTITVNSNPSANVTANGPTTFCSGGSVTLSVNTASGATYQWFKNSNPISGAASSSYIATASGSYHVVKTNSAGCSKTSTITTVTENAKPAATIAPSGTITFCAGQSALLTANSGGGYTYKWKKNGNYISGAAAMTYTVTTAGKYRVEVTNSNGCSKTSNADTVVVPCRETRGASVPIAIGIDVKVYPNPSSGDFVFEFSNSSFEITSIKIYDMIGKLILSEVATNPKFTIRNPQLVPGIYSAEIICGTNKKVLKLVKI